MEENTEGSSRNTTNLKVSDWNIYSAEDPRAKRHGQKNEPDRNGESPMHASMRKVVEDLLG